MKDMVLPLSSPSGSFTAARRSPLPRVFCKNVFSSNLLVPSLMFLISLNVFSRLFPNSPLKTSIVDDQISVGHKRINFSFLFETVSSNCIDIICVRKSKLEYISDLLIVPVESIPSWDF